MKSNIVINSSDFNIEKFIESNPDSYCCRFENNTELYRLIYLFFINGILLFPEDGTLNLHYLSY